MSLPNFLIVGAAKAGTTALHHYLKQHPQIYMSPHKETNFFSFEGQEVNFRGPGDVVISDTSITTLDEYERQFESVSGEAAIGEASPWYLYSPRAAENIRRHLPGAKLILVLRNPVDRAFSSYLHVIRDGRERLSFEDGLLAEEERIEQEWEFIWHYRQAGFYAAQVERFLSLFPEEQMRFYLYDDFSKNPEGLLGDIYEFLGVNADFAVNTSLRPNATGVPRNQLLGRLLLRPNPLRSAVKPFIPSQIRYSMSQRVSRHLIRKPSLAPETRTDLLSSYKADIHKLQNLLSRDLSAWLPE